MAIALLMLWRGGAVDEADVGGLALWLDFDGEKHVADGGERQGIGGDGGDGCEPSAGQGVGLGGAHGGTS